MLINYRKYKIDIQEGDIILFRTQWEPFKNPVSILSWFVRFFTLCRYNHSAIVVMRNGKLEIAEAKSEVVSNPIEQVLDRKRDKILVLRPQNIPSDCSKRVLSKEGTKYDLIALIWFHFLRSLPYVLFGKYGKWYGPIGEAAADKTVCSELIAYGLRLPKFWEKSSADFIDYEGIDYHFQEPLYPDKGEIVIRINIW